jgi:hypothetical protein
MMAMLRMFALVCAIGARFWKGGAKVGRIGQTVTGGARTPTPGVLHQKKASLLGKACVLAKKGGKTN